MSRLLDDVSLSEDGHVRPVSGHGRAEPAVESLSCGAYRRFHWAASLGGILGSGLVMRVLTEIVNRSESQIAFEMLKEGLQKGAKEFPDHPIGWQGGSRRHTAYWLPNLDIWTVLEASPPSIKKGPRHRFWNCFGLGNPAEQNMLTIAVEINPPHEGENRRVAGLFARDTAGRIYIGHTGKVGGGRIGIGQNAFRKYLGDDRWDEIQTQRGTRTAVILGPIDVPDFADQVAKFIHEVIDFKEGISKNLARK